MLFISPFYRWNNWGLQIKVLFFQFNVKIPHLTLCLFIVTPLFCILSWLLLWSQSILKRAQPHCYMLCPWWEEFSPATPIIEGGSDSLLLACWELLYPFNEVILSQAFGAACGSLTCSLSFSWLFDVCIKYSLKQYFMNKCSHQMTFLVMVLAY